MVKANTPPPNFTMRIVSLGLFLSSLSLLASGSNVARQSNSSGLTGDSVCLPLMCITATVNSTDVEYVLQSTGTSLGWMAMGFGKGMANSPMVIMWPNSDGSVTLSQRMASAEVMPTVQSSPPRVASKQPSKFDLTGTNVTLAFTVPKNTDTVQNVIWAFATNKPSSAAVDATLVQHLDSGPITLDLTKPLSGSGSPPPPTVVSPSTALLPYQRMIVAHAILCIVGFLFLLPLGALVGRYLRTVSNVWFNVHWFIQVFLAGPVIIVGFALGFVAVSKAGAKDLSDDHMKWGVAIFVLYLVQCIFGFVVHKFKPATASRPYQNYVHAILGLLIIALGLYQVRTGYKTEWTKQTGKMVLPKATDIVWILWVVLLPVLYFAGLALLPRQFRQEKEATMKE